ncbi:MAG: endonuclease/exonuclease/phosphatase family protein [Polyangiales bacterium]
MRLSLAACAWLFAACEGAPLEPFDESAQESPLVAAPVDSDCPQFRALTFNAFSILFHENHEELTRLGAEAVVAEDADLVAIQEVWLARDAAVYADALRGAGLVHQIQHTTDAVLARGSSGLLLASRFPIVAKRFIPFRSAAAPYWMWPPDWYANKGVLEVVVETGAGLLRVLNVHVHADYEPGGYLEERLGQSMELANLMRERPELPLVVLGDMNSQPHEVSHAVLTESTGAEVVARSDVDLILTRHGRGGALHVDSARYALVQRVRLQSGVWSRLSDHAGVLASLKQCPARSPRPVLEDVDAASRVIQEAANNARVQGLVARGGCAALAVVLLFWGGLMVRRRRWPSRYQVTLPLLLVWVIAWSVYQGWLAAPAQLAAYEALVSM